MTTTDIEARIAAVERRAAQAEAVLKAETATYRGCVLRSRGAIRDLIRDRRAHMLLSAFADARRELVRERIEKIVGLAIRAVFGSRVDFRFETAIKRGVVTMDPQVGYRIGGAMKWVSTESVGGGMADVVAFALRVAVLVRYRPRLRKILIADEPFKHLSEAYLPKVADMLRSLCDVTGLQMVIVSHEPEIADAANRRFVVEKDPRTGFSRVTQFAGKLSAHEEDEESRRCPACGETGGCRCASPG